MRNTVKSPDTKTQKGWPKRDSQGNPLNHAETCAWRFGGKCDCALAESKCPSCGANGAYKMNERDKPECVYCGEELEL